MEERSHEREVNFHKYCPLCKHRKKSENDLPCNTCLTSPKNLDSRKPVEFVEK